MTAVRSIDTVYFFCSTDSRGIEGIRHLKNFVALLTPYRVFYRYPKYHPREDYVRIHKKAVLRKIDKHRFAADLLNF